LLTLLVIIVAAAGIVTRILLQTDGGNRFVRKPLDKSLSAVIGIVTGIVTGIATGIMTGIATGIGIRTPIKFGFPDIGRRLPMAHIVSGFLDIWKDARAFGRFVGWQILSDLGIPLSTGL
jgi:hypothetical protein